VRADGARFELSLADQREKGTCRVYARSVVNAAGVWVDAVRQQSLLDSGQAMPERIVSASQGVHLVVSRDFMPGRHALLVPKTQDGRVLFAVPWMGALILGTTDTPRQDLPREPQAFEAELDFILSEASKVLIRPVRSADVLSMWVGLRPLVGSNQVQTGTKSLSREHTIVTDKNGLITVTGGKWTTYRSMAEDVMQACFEAGVLPRQKGQSSQNHVLLGAAAGNSGLAVCDPPGWHLYGSEESAVRACRGTEHAMGLGLTEAMVRFAARHEYAWTVEDVLARRWRALFLDARQAMVMAPEVARILSEETGQDPQLAEFMALSQKYI
jgi:glycerol-3-phosphate dehydrogenase